MTEIDYLMDLVKLESRDKNGRKVAKDLLPWVEELGRARFQIVPVFQWLANCTIDISFGEANEKRIRINPPTDRQGLREHFIDWLRSSGAAHIALKAFDAQTITVPRPGSSAWTYEAKRV